jgi:hypothetical protein
MDSFQKQHRIDRDAWQTDVEIVEAGCGAGGWALVPPPTDLGTNDHGRNLPRVAEYWGYGTP